jgi:hypothetical protein
LRAAVWFRVTAGLMLLFAAGHTFGFLTFDPGTPEGRAVLAAMNGTHFSVGGSTFSYGGFYLGFGLTISAVQLFEAWLAWQLGSMARRGVRDARVIAWGMVVLQMVGFGLSWRYVSIVPAVLSLATAVTLAVGAVSMRRVEVVSE